MVRCWPGVSDEITSPPVPCLQKGPLDLIEMGKGLKVQTDKPHLVSLGSGRLSTAITLVPLEEGKSGPSVLIHIPALGPRPVLDPFCYLLAVVPPYHTSLLPWPLPPQTACPLWLIIWLHD